MIGSQQPNVETRATLRGLTRPVYPRGPQKKEKKREFAGIGRLARGKNQMPSRERP